VVGLHETSVQTAYSRVVAMIKLASIAESRAAAMARIDGRRAVLYAELAKQRQRVGSDPKKLLDTGALHDLFAMLLDLDRREAKLIGLDAPAKFSMAWGGSVLGPDLITAQELDRLDDSELRQLFHLLDKARGNGAVEVESRRVETLNFELAKPTPAPPAVEYAPAPVQPASTTPPEWEEIARRESTERYRPLPEAEATIAKLDSTDPVTRVGDPIVRRELAKQANEVLVRFGRKPWREWQGN